MSDATVYFRNAQAERGNIPTAWRPSLNDQNKNTDNDLAFIKKIFPSGLINNAATVSQLLAVRDEDNDIVAGIYGGGMPETDEKAKGFKDSAHGKLMIFAGASDLEHVAEAGTRIYEDGTIITSKLVAINADISGKITATSGHIGIFDINTNGWLKASRDTYSMGFSAAAFTLESKDNDLGSDGKLDEAHIHMSAIPGMSPFFVGLDIKSKATITKSASAFSNIGIQLDITGANGNSGFYTERGNHALRIINGDISGFRLFTRRLTGTQNISKMDSVILCWNATLTLPANPEDGQIYFIKQINNGAITLNVGATDHYINDGRTNRKAYWTWNEGCFIIVVWDALNKTWQAGYTNNN